MGVFTYFDVETPNRFNNRMSAMGIIHVVDGVTVHEKSYLLNPEVHFDAFNIELTGITPQMIKTAPTLKQIWSEIEPYFVDTIIVAHNATFDLGVLSATLAHYGLGHYGFEYIDTVRLAKKHLKYKRNNLAYLCATLGILMDRHHEALSDAKACQELFYYLVERFGFTDDDVQFYRYGSSKRF